MPQQGHWVYIVTNNSAGYDTEHTDEAEALAEATRRSAFERGQVAVEKAFLKPGDVRSFNVDGAGTIWRSEWNTNGTKGSDERT